MRYKTDAGETMLRTKVRLLEDLVELIRIETIVGQPAAAFKAFDESAGRIEAWRQHINEAARVVIHQKDNEFSHLGPIAQRTARSTRRKEFLSASLGHGAGTRFISFAGGNLTTELGLWATTDVHHNITERTFIKDICFDKSPEENDWNDPQLWQNHGDPLSKFLTEAHIMERLRDTNSENVVTLRQWRRYTEKLTFRVSLQLTEALLESLLIK